MASLKKCLDDGVTSFEGSTRRQFLSSAVGVGAGLLTASRGVSASPVTTSEDPILSFFVVGDTHYLAERENPDRIDPRSHVACSNLVDTLNRLPGSRLPSELGGGQVLDPQGVIHVGDIVDSADKHGAPYTHMATSEFNAFEGDFGLSGSDGRLRHPVYELHGNHDGPRGDTPVVEGIIRRNRRRPGVNHISKSGLHYAWDWGPLRLLSLGIVVGRSPDGAPRRYEPFDSLSFLEDDLAAHVGDTGRPVVICQHIDLLRYSRPPTARDNAHKNAEWHPQDVHRFYQVTTRYNVVADFHGHTHARRVFGWEGTDAPLTLEENRLAVFNTDNASHFASAKQACFYVEVTRSTLSVLELSTSDAWDTHKWSSARWTIRHST